MQFWQPCLQMFKKRPRKLLNVRNLKQLKFFSKKCLLKMILCRLGKQFWYSRRKMFRKKLMYFRSMSKSDSRKTVFQRKFFSSEQSSRNLECSFHKSAGKKIARRPNSSAQHRKLMIKKFLCLSFSLKKFLWPNWR